MGLITHQMGSATINAEVPSVLYELSADAYERLKRENSALAQALLTYGVRAERLSFRQPGDRHPAPLSLASDRRKAIQSHPQAGKIRS
jgi:hypothetical protein